MNWLFPGEPLPPPEQSSPEGILALCDHLDEERVKEAYSNGIFPWYEDGEAVMWWSPPERMVLRPGEVKVSKSMRSFLRKTPLTYTINQCFNEVITHCQGIERQGQDGTWITEEMKAVYNSLHHQKIAHSVEVWHGEQLVGGLYGINQGKIFCGESMFSLMPNVSKAAFIFLCRHLEAAQYALIDCQVYNEHLASLGAYEIPRSEFLALLHQHKGEEGAF